MPKSSNQPTLTEIPRDVLKMLRVELREALAGNWQLCPGEDGVDIDFVEMLQQTIARLTRLQTALEIIAGEQPPIADRLAPADLARIALHGR